nr:hypothetical protein CFP56_08852 [Quercus suber]
MILPLAVTRLLLASCFFCIFVLENHARLLGLVAFLLYVARFLNWNAGTLVWIKFRDRTSTSQQWWTNLFKIFDLV